MDRTLGKTPAAFSGIRGLGAGGLIGFVLSALCSVASAAGPASPGLSPAQAARIAHACTATMGFSDGTVQYADCVSSLSNSLAGIQQAGGVKDIRMECADRTRKDGTTDAAQCSPDPGGER